MPAMPRQIQGDDDGAKTPTVTLQGYLERVIDERMASMEQLVDERSRQYEQRFLDSKEAVLIAMASAKEATAKADIANEKRFESVNEFRATLSDQQKNLIGRAESVSMFKAIDDKIDALRLVSEAARSALKSSFDERLENLNKRFAVHDITLVGAVTQVTFETRMAEVQKMVNDLRETRSGSIAKDNQADKTQSRDQWIVGLLIGAGLTIAGLAVAASNLIINLTR